MNRYTFRDREVVELCKQFVCAKIQFKPGAADTQRYKIEGTPTYVILDTDGSEIARQSGFSRPTDFAAWLRSALR
jgi:RNA polymerase subunit RPABC4/transcription elongation factor Spt4